MSFRAILAAIFASLTSAGTVAAQDKHDVFVGQYMAAQIVALECDGFTIRSPEAAANIGRFDEGLRKQKLLRTFFYGKTASLMAAGRATLSERGVDPASKSAICRFGQSVAGLNDVTGRFLKSK